MREVPIGARIRERREELGMTQAALAEAIGTAQANISAIEAGRREPTIAVAKRIAAALKTTVGWLIGET